MNRDANGRFGPGNQWAAQGGRARAKALPARRRKEIARLGFAAMVQKWFDGDKQAAVDWLAKRGVWASDRMYREDGLGVFKDPGPHPAHRETFRLETISELAF